MSKKDEEPKEPKDKDELSEEELRKITEEYQRIVEKQ
jgi:hypothetical protein